jgi:hypothetical protein
MIIEIDASVLPVPLVIDTARKHGSGSGTGAAGVVRETALQQVQPVITLRDREGGISLFDWAPYGRPDSHLPAFLLIVGVALVATFAAIGIASTMK